MDCTFVIPFINAQCDALHAAELEVGSQLQPLTDALLPSPPQHLNLCLSPQNTLFLFMVPGILNPLTAQTACSDTSAATED